MIIWLRFDAFHMWLNFVFLFCFSDTRQMSSAVEYSVQIYYNSDYENISYEPVIFYVICHNIAIYASCMTVHKMI